jgi:hypothetical protein
MVRLLVLSFAVTALTACAIAPNPAETGWADALLADAPPGEAPASVSTEPLDADMRRALLTAAVATQMRGQTIRLDGMRLRAPTLDTAEFVVEARERARPPEPR